MTFNWKMKLSNGKICSSTVTRSSFGGLNPKTDRKTNMNDTDYGSDDMAHLDGMCTSAQIREVQKAQAQDEEIIGRIWGMGQLKQNYLAKNLINYCNVYEYRMNI